MSPLNDIIIPSEDRDDLCRIFESASWRSRFMLKDEWDDLPDRVKPEKFTYSAMATMLGSLIKVKEFIEKYCYDMEGSYERFGGGRLGLRELGGIEEEIDKYTNKLDEYARLEAIDSDWVSQTKEMYGI